MRSQNIENCMNFLKNNFILLLAFYGCTSINSTYNTTIDKDGGVEVVAISNRFSPYCEKVVKDDGTIAYGFMILFLDEEKTIGSATGMLTSNKACSEWQAEVKKILIHGQLVTLRGFGLGMEHPRLVEDFTHSFDNYGTYHGNGRSMDFFSIRNNNGECFATNTDRCL